MSAGWPKLTRSLFRMAALAPASELSPTAGRYIWISVELFQMWRGWWGINASRGTSLEPSVWRTADDVQGGWDYLQLLAGRYKHQISTLGSPSSKSRDASLSPLTDCLSRMDVSSSDANLKHFCPQNKVVVFLFFFLIICAWAHLLEVHDGLEC